MRVALTWEKAVVLSLSKGGFACGAGGCCWWRCGRRHGLRSCRSSAQEWFLSRGLPSGGKTGTTPSPGSFRSGSGLLGLIPTSLRYHWYLSAAVQRSRARLRRNESAARTWALHHYLCFPKCAFVLVCKSDCFPDGCWVSSRTSRCASPSAAMLPLSGWCPSQFW